MLRIKGLGFRGPALDAEDQGSRDKELGVAVGV